MFTGIIEELGRISAVEEHAGGVRISFDAAVVTDGTADGDSIAVNGVCLTALAVNERSFAADVSPETLAVTTLGGLRPGSPVNLERAVMLSTRLGGHIVQGHVDARGKFLAAEPTGEFWKVTIGFPEDFARYLIYKGSVAVEGISLTVAELRDDSFDIAIIPKTWERTNLSTLKPGDPVNLEADMIAKYIERLIQTTEPAPRVTMETLEKAGFL